MVAGQNQTADTMFFSDEAAGLPRTASASAAILLGVYPTSTHADVCRTWGAVMGGLEGRTLAQRLAGLRTSRARSGPLAAALLTIALTCCLFGPIAPASAAPLGSSAQALLAPMTVHQAELTPADGAASDMFGYSVALSGGTALVGAYGHATAGKACAGAAYVFVRSGTSWTQQAELTDPEAAANDQFGSSVALSGDTALVAAPGETAGGLPGAAYVYVRSGTTWTQQAELTSAGPAYGFFGTRWRSMAIRHW